jgi:hypothetical protein
VIPLPIRAQKSRAHPLPRRLSPPPSARSSRRRLSSHPSCPRRPNPIPSRWRTSLTRRPRQEAEATVRTEAEETRAAARGAGEA